MVWNGLCEGTKLCMWVDLAMKGPGVTGSILKMQAGIMQSWSSFYGLQFILMELEEINQIYFGKGGRLHDLVVGNCFGILHTHPLFYLWSV